MDLFDLQIHEFLDSLLKIAVAFVLALPVAWDREKESSSAGIRTFPLVSIACCGYVLLGNKMADSNAESMSRVIQGLVAGIGFIGGGAILKDQGRVHGTATAASVWNTGAIGATVALNELGIALLLSIVNFATLRWFRPIKESIKPHENHTQNQTVATSQESSSGFKTSEGIQR